MVSPHEEVQGVGWAGYFLRHTFLDIAQDMGGDIGGDIGRNIGREPTDQEKLKKGAKNITIEYVIMIMTRKITQKCLDL